MAKRKVLKIGDDGKEIIERPLRTFTLLMSKSGSSTSQWLEFGEGGINSNSVPFYPPYDCKLISVSYSNLNSQDTSIFSLRTFFEDGDEAGSIGTGDPNFDIDINSFGGATYARTDRRAWSHDDLFEQNINFVRNFRYAFRIQRLSGGQSYNDAFFHLTFQEADL